ncbi:MAG: SRPBCC family protein [Sphingomicrobium sp.]
MTDIATAESYGVLSEDATLTLERLLPGSIDRVWAYLTETDLRRQWLAAGVMEMRVGAPVELVWRNDQLTDAPERRPEGFGEEHRLESEIIDLDPPHRLSISWGSTGGVTFELEPVGDMVRFTVTHHRIPDRSTMLNVSAGWHAHLEVLAARLAGDNPKPFWTRWTSLKAEYEERLPTAA